MMTNSNRSTAGYFIKKMHWCSHSNSVQNNTRVFPLQGAANRKTTIPNGHWEVFQTGEDFKYHTV